MTNNPSDAREAATKVQSRYPGITKAALEIGYDNGGIHRFRSETSLLRRLNRFLAKCALDTEQLNSIDRWLGGLPADQLFTVCAGEETEMLAILKDGPVFTHDLLNDIFEKVC